MANRPDDDWRLETLSVESNNLKFENKSISGSWGSNFWSLYSSLDESPEIAGAANFWSNRRQALNISEKAKLKETLPNFKMAQVSSLLKFLIVQASNFIVGRSIRNTDVLVIGQPW